MASRILLSMAGMIVPEQLHYNILANQRPKTMGPTQIRYNDKSTNLPLETYSVLVADDERSMADLLAINLRRIGHRVVSLASIGRQAVDMALRLRPDLLIMDIEMPVLDGLSAAREILGKWQVPIVMSTGVSDATAVHTAINLNLISFLVKPFSPAQLKVAVQLAVAQSRGLAKAGAPATAA